MSADLKEVTVRYNNAWNAHDLVSIIAMHAPDMVFENHTVGDTGRPAGLAGSARRPPESRGPR